MRGSPALHLVLFAVGFALLSVPLAKLTFARPDSNRNSIEASADPLAATPTVMRLRFAHVPTSVSVKLGGKELLPAKPSTQTATNIKARTELAIPKEGFDLLVNATWPSGTPDTALTLELEPDELDAQSQTRWSTGAKLSEVFTFQWKKP